MKMRKTFFILLILLVILLVGCTQQNSSKESHTSTTKMKIANPAAVYCSGLGYEYIYKPDGSLCRFPNGEECKAWDFFNGKCGEKYTFCEKHGGKILTARKNCSFSSEYAVCVLPNGVECLEWDYFRGKCP